MYKQRAFYSLLSEGVRAVLLSCGHGAVLCVLRKTGLFDCLDMPRNAVCFYQLAFHHWRHLIVSFEPGVCREQQEGWRRLRRRNSTGNLETICGRVSTERFLRGRTGGVQEVSRKDRDGGGELKK